MTNNDHTRTGLASVIDLECHRAPDHTSPLSRFESTGAIPSDESQEDTLRQPPLPETAKPTPNALAETMCKPESRAQGYEEGQGQCPFVYANGKRCTGEVIRIRAYGSWDSGSGKLQYVKSYYVMCTPPSDRGCMCSRGAANDPMEFYPGQVPGDLLEWAERKGIVE